MLALHQDDDGVMSAIFSGNLTIYEVGEYQQQLNALPQLAGDWRVDLAGVSEIDTAGLQLLMALRNHLGEQLTMVSHSPAVIELLDLYRLAPFFGDAIVLAGEGRQEA